MLSTDQVEAMEARCKKAKEEVIAICTGTHKWTMCVPVQESDSDRVVMTALNDTSILLADWRAMRKLLIEASGMLKLLDRNTEHESVTAWLAKWQAFAALTPEPSR